MKFENKRCLVRLGVWAVARGVAIGLAVTIAVWLTVAIGLTVTLAFWLTVAVVVGGALVCATDSGAGCGAAQPMLLVEVAPHHHEERNEHKPEQPGH